MDVQRTRPAVRPREAVRFSPRGAGSVPGDGSKSLELRLEVERQDRALVFGVAPCFTRNGPHDLELVAVRVAAVERLRDDVVARPAEGAGFLESLPGGGEILDRRDLPGEVIQPDRAAGGPRRVGTDGEEPEIVVVRGERRPHEDGLPVHLAADDLEPEDPTVELGRPRRVADEEDGVVQAGDWDAHRISLCGSSIP